MPHQCVKCGDLYPNGSEELLKGSKCGARFFFYVREKDIFYEQGDLYIEQNNQKIKNRHRP